MYSTARNGVPGHAMQMLKQNGKAGGLKAAHAGSPSQCYRARRSVPSGRVGSAKDAVFRSNEHFREAVSERERADVQELEHRLDRQGFSAGFHDHRSQLQRAVTDPLLSLACSKGACRPGWHAVRN